MTLLAPIETVTPDEAWAATPPSRQRTLLAEVEAAIRARGLARARPGVIARALALHRLTPAQRLEVVRARGLVPDQCGPEIAAAPARGSFRTFTPFEATPVGDGVKITQAGYRGRRAIRGLDAFDKMEAQAKGRDKPHPLTPSQIDMGRHYRALVEFAAGAGPRGCLAAGIGGGGGGGPEAFIGALIDADREIAILETRIGPGIAKEVRRQRPSVTGSKRAIRDLVLAQMVCLGDGTVRDVMIAHGWAYDGRLAAILTRALAASLERMIGPTPRPGRTSFSTLDTGDALSQAVAGGATYGRGRV